MFRFKLEALLKHRRHQEEFCQKELAQVKRQLAGEQRRLHQLKTEQRDHIQKLPGKQRSNMKIADITLSLNYIQKLSENIENQQVCVRDTAKQVDQKRGELIGIVKKRKTLEKLKEKQTKAYQQRIMQDDRKLMDEVASMRHARKM